MVKIMISSSDNEELKNSISKMSSIFNVKKISKPYKAPNGEHSRVYLKVQQK